MRTAYRRFASFLRVLTLATATISCGLSDPSLAVDPSGDHIAVFSTAYLGQISEYDTRTGRRISRRTMPFQERTEPLAYSPDGTLLAIVRGSHLHLFRAGHDLERVGEWLGYEFSNVDYMEWAGNSRVLMLWSVGDPILFFDTQQGTAFYVGRTGFWNSRVHFDYDQRESILVPTRVRMSPDMRRLAILESNSSSSLHILDLAKMMAATASARPGSPTIVSRSSFVSADVDLRRLLGQRVASVAFAPAPQEILACTSNGLSVVDLAAQQVSRRFATPCYEVTATTDGHTVIAIGDGIHIIDLTMGTISTIQGTYAAVATNVAGSLVATLGRDGALSLLTVREKRVQRTFKR